MKTQGAKNWVQIECNEVQFERVQLGEREVDLVPYRPPLGLVQRAAEPAEVIEYRPRPALPLLVLEAAVEILRALFEFVIDEAGRAADQRRRRRQLRDTVREAYAESGQDRAPVRRQPDRPNRTSGQGGGYGRPQVQVNVSTHVTINQ